MRDDAAGEAQTSQDSIGRERVCDGLRAVIRCSVAALQLRQYLYCCASKASKLSAKRSRSALSISVCTFVPVTVKPEPGDLCGIPQREADL